MDVTSPDDYIGLAEVKSPKATLPDVNNIEPLPLPEVNMAPAVAAQLPEPPVVSRVEPSEPLSISVTSATLLALENNKSLVVQKFNPQLKRTTEQELLSVFDLDLTAGFANTQRKTTTGPIKSRSRTNSADV